MKVYQTHEGFFVGVTYADKSPLDDEWLIPDGCVTTPPPALAGDQRALWDGANWSIVEPEVDKPVEPVPPTLDELTTVARRTRNAKLKASDWAMMPDAPTDQDAWAAYRQSLRDVPQQVGFPMDILWPTPPV